MTIFMFCYSISKFSLLNKSSARNSCIDILNASAILTSVSNLILYYTPTCMNDRNKYMAEHSSIVIACWNGKPSGTEYTIRFAKENGCKVRIIDINQYK